jgi:3-ketosteroid 9alpha-monooxygenase subunit A
MTGMQPTPATQDGDPNWPYSVHPSGWFQVAWSSEIPVGGVVPLRYCDTDLAAFRDEAGEVHVLDAHCPHLGAHLGYGGTVKGCDIVCPFHGWQWSGEGANTLIPYSTTINRAQRIRSWPVREYDGLIVVWHHPEGQDPTWEPSSLASIVENFDPTDFYPVYPHGSAIWTGVRVRPQMVVENIVDAAHFQHVHSAKTSTTIEAHLAEGPRFTVSHRFDSGQGLRVDIQSGGLGLLVGVFADSRGVSHIELQATTPVDGDRSDLRDSVWVRRDEKSPDAPPEKLQRVIERQHVELSRDIPIWDHLAYRPRPPFVPEENRPYRALRSWAAQFYETSAHG